MVKKKKRLLGLSSTPTEQQLGMQGLYDAWRNLRMRKGQEMRREWDVWKKAPRQFLWATDVLRFHTDQWIQASSIWKNDGRGLFAFGVFPTQHKVLKHPKGESFYKYLIGKTSSMYVRLTKVLWNNCFSESIKIQVSEDTNNSMGGTYGLMNPLCPHKTTHSLPLERKTKIWWQSGSPTPLFFKDCITPKIHLFFLLNKVHSSKFILSLCLQTIWFLTQEDFCMPHSSTAHPFCTWAISLTQYGQWYYLLFLTQSRNTSQL